MDRKTTTILTDSYNHVGQFNEYHGYQKLFIYRLAWPPYCKALISY